MNKITIIQLLNKIANEELAYEQEFKYDGVITDMEMFSNEYLLNEDVLNFEIELIEIKKEDKEIEKGIKPFEEYWEEIEATDCDKDEAQKVYFDRLSKIVIELANVVNELKKGK